MDITHPYQGHYMEDAFLSFVGFAATHLMEQYTAECGTPALATDPLGRMIDDATGVHQKEAQKFIDWCVIQFGDPDEIGVGSAPNGKEQS